MPLEARSVAPIDAATQSRLVAATTFAYRWHGDQTRKGSTIPYMGHLLQVKGLVLEHGGDIEQAIAALLHDSLEDAETPADARARARDIAEHFGEGALAIVRDCSDTQADEAGAAKRPWPERKERYIAHLRVAPERSLLVVACDKLHNLNALVWDVEEQGAEYLHRFNAGPEQQVWYYESVLAVADGRVPTRLQAELAELVRRFRKLVS
jgi:(p)ppGpp synthase/HD superfamily hydrolase